MLDKMEPPSVPDGYGISVAYGCLLDIVRSISLAIHGPSKVPNSTNTFSSKQQIELRTDLRFIFQLKLGEQTAFQYKDRVTQEERALHAQLITSSWCGLLAALTPLIDAATDESATENVLKAMQNYASLCGTLGKSFLQNQCTIHMA